MESEAAPSCKFKTYINNMLKQSEESKTVDQTELTQWIKETGKMIKIDP